MTDSASALHPGAEVERYTVLDLIGVGATAEVYRVRHSLLGTEHALKLLTHTHPGMLDRFLQEARVQAGLRHPNIVSVTDVLPLQGQPCLVQELIDGPTLTRWLVQQGAMPTEAAVAMALAVADAVAAAHAAGILHRDLKPDNILLLPGPPVVPKVTDFGLAKVRAEGLMAAGRREGMTRERVAMGTPGYMAPEQWADAATVDGRADIFSLAAILYTAIACRPPFPVDGVEAVEAAINGRFVPLSDLAPSCPPAVAAVVARGLAPSPDDRFPDAPAFAQALRGALLGRLPTPPPEQAHRPPVAQPSLAAPSGPMPTTLPSPGGPPPGPPPTAVPDVHTMVQPDQAAALPEAPPLPAAAAAAAPTAPGRPAARRLGLPVLAVATVLVLGAGLSMAWILRSGGVVEQLHDGLAPPGPARVAIPATTAWHGDVWGDGLADERPAVQVQLAAFEIDRLEVSTAAWLDCVDRGVCTPAEWADDPDAPPYAGFTFADQPIVGVTRDQAAAFCADAGGRLPTEQEWEAAATWSPDARDKTDKRRWPWGDQPPDCQRAHAAGCGETTATIGSAPAGASAFGVEDMSGNVWEWTASRYPLRKKIFRRTPDHWVLRGGAYDSSPASLRPTFRRHTLANDARPNTGFRCVYDVVAAEPGGRTESP